MAAKKQTIERHDQEEPGASVVCGNRGALEGTGTCTSALLNGLDQAVECAGGDGPLPLAVWRRWKGRLGTRPFLGLFRPKQRKISVLLEQVGWNHDNWAVVVF
jgi:hypothetical protein